ncbi:hypothetical protein LCGC14_3076200, partial [marine sediment metagenome]
MSGKPKLYAIPCGICGVQRMVPLRHGMPEAKHCRKCASILRIKPTLPLTHNPVIGETRYGRELKHKVKGQRYKWVACPVCQECRWVAISKDGTLTWSKSNDTLCKLHRHPKGALAPNWKGGKRTTTAGYVLISLEVVDPFWHPMNNGRNAVLEHRLVMAEHLGRCLHKWEIVHHKNHIRDDNRIENLQLLPDKGTHMV